MTKREYGPDYDPSLALRWVEALESGRYDQTRDHLRIGNTFCCLGVACDVAYNPNQPTTTEGWDTDGTFFYHELTFDGLPPAPLMLRYGLATSTPYDNQPWSDLDRESDRTELNELNDNYAYTFTDIAALLRAYYGFPPKQEPTPPPLAQDAICDGYHEDEGDPFD